MFLSNSPLRPSLSTRGMTLVELMIVVAIVGVLASIGIVSYNSYMEAGRLTELRQYAMAVEQGQKQYFSRHHEYFQPDDEGDRTYDHESYGDEEWGQLLGFDERLPPNIRIQVEAGHGNCGLGPGDVDDDAPCYGVLAQNQDLDHDIFAGTGVEGTIEVASDWVN